MAKTSGTFFPEDYPKHKVVKTLKKIRSPRTLIIATDDKNEWFYDIFEIMTKSTEVVDISGMVIAKDLENRMSWYNRLGYEEV